MPLCRSAMIAPGSHEPQSRLHDLHVFVGHVVAQVVLRHPVHAEIHRREVGTAGDRVPADAPGRNLIQRRDQPRQQIRRIRDRCRTSERCRCATSPASSATRRPKDPAAARRCRASDRLASTRPSSRRHRKSPRSAVVEAGALQARAMSMNSSGTIQLRPIWPVHGSPQACTLEPCRNQPRWKGFAAIGPLPSHRLLHAIIVPTIRTVIASAAEQCRSQCRPVTPLETALALLDKRAPRLLRILGMLQDRTGVGRQHHRLSPSCCPSRHA